MNIENNLPPMLHIVGPKKSGKTTLLDFLIRGLTERGYAVGAFKHSSHVHPLDKSGSDSDRLRLAGANPSVFNTPEGVAIVSNHHNSRLQEKLFAAAFADCDLVLVESYRSADGPKIALLGQDGDLEGVTNVIAVINPEGRYSVLPAFRAQDPAIIGFIVKMIDGSRKL